MTGLFELGERVVWVLTARGVVRQQQGVVAEVVPAGQRPTGITRGLVRDHESYAITANGVGYWPPVSGLAPVADPIKETSTDGELRRAAEVD